MKISTIFHNLFEAENEQTDVNAEAAQIVKVLRKKCGPWVEAYTKNHDLIFYRGYSSGTAEDENFILKRTRKNRVPRDSQVLAHRLFNKILSDFGNNPKWRSSSVFVSTNEATSSQYGTIWIMIPVGKFDALTSNSIVDLYTFFDPTSFNDYRHIGKFIDANTVSRAVLDGWIRKTEKTSVYKSICNGVASFIEKLLPADLNAKKLPIARQCIRTAMNDIYNGNYPHALIELMLQLGARIYYFGSASAALSSAERYMTEFGLDWTPMYHVLRSEFRKAELDIDLADNHKVVNGFDRLRDTFVRKLIIANSDALVQLYVDMVSTVVKNSYVYYTDPSKMRELSPDQEIMIRCDEYYLIKPTMFNLVKRQLIGDTK